MGFGELEVYGAPHGFVECEGKVWADPVMWLEGLDLLMGKLKEEFGCGEIVGVSGSGQQHGSVYLKDGFGEVLMNLNSKVDLKGQMTRCFSRRESPSMDGWEYGE